MSLRWTKKNQGGGESGNGANDHWTLRRSLGRKNKTSVNPGVMSRTGEPKDLPQTQRWMKKSDHWTMNRNGKQQSNANQHQRKKEDAPKRSGEPALAKMGARWTKRENGTGVQHWTLRRSMKRDQKTKKKPTSTMQEQSPASLMKKRFSLRTITGSTTNPKPATAAGEKKTASRLRIPVDTSLGRTKSTKQKEYKSQSPESVKLSQVKIGNLDGFEIVHIGSGASIKVCTLGGTLCSYKDGSGLERLFFSEKAKTDGSKPIRGGVPVVFPQFGKNGPVSMSHGFARNMMWEMHEEPKLVDDMVHVSFKLKSDKATKKMWNHDFELIHVIRFGNDELETCMSIQNQNKNKSFDFQGLLHTYIRVDDIAQTEIQGLAGCSFIDQLDFEMPGEGKRIWVETAESLKIASEIDNIYMDVGKEEPIVVDTPTGSVEIHVALARDADIQDCDVVVWNPHMAKSKRMDDFADEEYHEMICIEPGCVSRTETCKPQQSWTITQNMKFHN